MTTYTTNTDIPPALRTTAFLERLLAWCLLTLFNLYKALPYKELENALSEKVIDISIIQAADGTERLIFRGSLELDPAWRASTAGKLWMFVREWGGVAVPAAYRVD